MLCVNLHDFNDFFIYIKQHAVFLNSTNVSFIVILHTNNICTRTIKILDMIEQQLYLAILLIAGAINLMIAAVLWYNSFWYQNYRVYYRARILLALNYCIFALGFIFHMIFNWRVLCPAMASALSVSYFHCGGVLFGWSHTSLLNPGYLTRKVVIRDLLILVIGLVSYWVAVSIMPSDAYIIARPSLAILHSAFMIFFAHALFITYTFYRTYYRVRHNLLRLPTGDKAPVWWNSDIRRTVLAHHHSFIIGGHLIILFGIGSIAVTAAFPTELWPYTILMALGIAVFCYIFYSITEYGNVIESATNATEDIARSLFVTAKVKRGV